MGSHAAGSWRLALASALALISSTPLALGAGQGWSDGQALTAVHVLAAMPAAGTDLRVGTISIEVFDVFDTAAGSESFPLAHTANLLHPRTRPTVVRRELLFRTGDRFDPEALRQTERNLRATGLFRRVEIQTLPPQDGVVTVEIRVYDAWTLTTGTSYRHEGGFSSYDVRLREDNVAGFGVGVSARYAVGFERREMDWSYNDARLLGSRERLAVSFANRSDGDVREFSLSRPFYTLSAPSAHGVDWHSAQERYRTYADGRVVHEYDLSTTDGAIGWAGRMSPVIRESVWRLGAGYRYTGREYSLLPGATSGDQLGMPSSYRWGGPFVGVQFLQHQYEKRNDILAPDRDIDFNLGLNVNLDVFVSSRYTAPQASDRIVAVCSVERGWRLPGRGLAVMTARGASESGGSTPAHGEVTATTRLWVPHSKTHVTAVFLEGRALLNPDHGVLVYLGGTPGLRGFRENQFAGTRSILLVAEDHKYLAWRPGGLIQPGVAAFIEIGAIDGGVHPHSAGIMHADVGLGIRLVNLKVSGLNVIKADVAVPIGEPWQGGHGVQFVVGFRRDL